MDFIQIMREWSPWVALVAFVLWSGWKREKRSDRKVDAQDKWMREVMMTHLERSNQVIAENNVILIGTKQVLQENGLVFQQYVRKLKDESKS